MHIATWKFIRRLMRNAHDWLARTAVAEEREYRRNRRSSRARPHGTLGHLTTSEYAKSGQTLKINCLNLGEISSSRNFYF